MAPSPSGLSRLAVPPQSSHDTAPHAVSWVVVLLTVGEAATIAKKFYSPKELEKILDASSSTIARRIRDGQIHSVKLGGRVLIPISFIDELTARANTATMASNSETKEERV